MLKAQMGDMRPGGDMSDMLHVQNKAQAMPVIRIVQIISPTYVNTDAANFRSLVQKLTGKDATSRSKRTSSLDKANQVVKRRKLPNLDHSEAVQEILPSEENLSDGFDVKRVEGFVQQSLHRANIEVEGVWSESEALTFLSAASQSNETSLFALGLNEISDATEMCINGELDCLDFQHMLAATLPDASTLPYFTNTQDHQLLPCFTNTQDHRLFATY